MAYHFFIVGHGDTPLYDLEAVAGLPAAPRLGNGVRAEAGKKDPLALSDVEEARLERQLTAWSALDTMDALQWTNQALLLRAFETFKEWTISGFITSGNIRFILLHTAKMDDGIRLFFNDVWDLYVKTLMNPFYRVNQPLASPVFDMRVKASARRHLGA